MNEGHMQVCTSDDWRQILWDQILPRAMGRVDLGLRVVEVGPGPGFTTEVLLRSCEQVTAVEVDPDLAEQLRVRLADRGAEVIVGDARATGLPASSHTGAASFHMLHHIPTDMDQDQIFVELRRLLVPGGALLLADGFDSVEVRRFHEGDTYHPIDPHSLAARLGASGFIGVDVDTYDLGWICWAAAPS